MRVILYRVRKLVLEGLFHQITIVIAVSLPMVPNMAKAELNGRMANFTMVTFITIISKVKVDTFGRTVNNIRGTGLKIKCTVMVLPHGRVVVNTKESILKATSTDLVNIHTPRGKFMSVVGKMVYNEGMESCTKIQN